MEKKMEQNTEENVIGQGIEDDQNIRNREDEVKDTYVDRQGTEPEMSGEDRKMYEIYMKKAIKLAQKAYVQGDVPIVQARIPKVVIGCMNKKAGCAGSILNMFDMSAFNHQVETVYGICQEECSSLMKDFFADLRKGMVVGSRQR